MAYSVEGLLSVLHPHCPVKVDALCKNCRRRHGLTTWGSRSTVLATTGNLKSHSGFGRAVSGNRWVLCARPRVGDRDPAARGERAEAIIAACMAPNEKVQAYGPLPEAAVKALGLKPGSFKHA